MRGPMQLPLPQLTQIQGTNPARRVKVAHSDKTTNSATRKKLKVGRLPACPPLPSNWSPWDQDNKGTGMEAA